MEEIKPLQNSQKNKQPSNLEAEQALLGSILVNNDIIDEVSSLVKSNIFYDPAHIKIYEVIESLNNKGMIANPITLKNFFEKDNMLNEVGGTEYLVKLTRFSGSVKQALDYAKIIHEMYLRRELVQISDKLSTDTLNANAQEQNAENIIETTEKSLFDLAERGSFSQSFLKFNQALDQTIEMATLAMQNDQGIVGVPTGLADLDEKLGGLHKSDLVILAGRPSMGKTALATNIAYHAAQNIMSKQEKSSVAFFSLEMSSEQLSTRILSEQARIKSDDIRRGKVTEEEINRYIKDKKSTFEIRTCEDETFFQRMIKSFMRLLGLFQDYLLPIILFYILINYTNKIRNRLSNVEGMFGNFKLSFVLMNIVLIVSLGSLLYPAFSEKFSYFIRSENK